MSLAARVASPPAIEESNRWSSGLKGLPLLSAWFLFLVAVGVVVSIPLQGRLIAQPDAINLTSSFLPPIPFGGSALSHPLGTDELGRDVLSRLVVGLRLSVLICLAVIALGGFVGTLGGLVAGYSGGLVDAAIMRVADVLLSFPAILIALALVVSLGPSFWIVIGVLTVGLAPQFARVVRSEVVSWKQRGFVLLARATGASTSRIIRVHLLPNIMNSVIVLATLQVGWVIVGESGLSFLGAGIPPPAPSLGNMLSDGSEYIYQAWWLTVEPGVAIALLVLSFNVLGDWLRDTFDPKLRQLGL